MKLLIIPLALFMLGCATPREYHVVNKRIQLNGTEYVSHSLGYEQRSTPVIYWMDVLDEDNLMHTKQFFKSDFERARINQPITVNY